MRKSAYNPPRGPGKGVGNGNPKTTLDTSPEKQRERSEKAQGSFLARRMAAWREEQERNNPDYQGPPKPLSRPEIEALARSHAPDAIEVLVNVATSERTAAVARVTAANSLLDRGYGKPRETVDMTTKIEAMTADEARAELVAELARIGVVQPKNQGSASTDQTAGD
jgi:hypothetical protein